MGKNFFGLTLIYLILILAPFASALTGSIGNAKAIVTVDLSETKVLERTVLVKNVNNISVDIKLEAADDLELITEIIDNEFTLEPNQEKKARFKVNIPKEGIYNGNIVVFFKPTDGKGAGVALQSNLILKVTGKSSTETKDEEPEFLENLFNKDENSQENLVTGTTVKETNNETFGPAIILFLTLIGVIVASVFIFVMRKI